MTAYQFALSQHDAIEAEASAASLHLKAISKCEGTSSMGLTPDHIKATPEWKAAHTGYYAASRKLQNFNRGFLKQFSKEWRATLMERRIAKSSVSA